MARTSAAALLDVRPMRSTDVRRVVTLHAQLLPSGFFARLGEGFLRRYYATFIESPHAVALTATMDGVPVGMIVGPTHTQRHYRWTARRHGWRLAARGIAALVCRPTLLLAFMRTRTLRYVRALRRMLGSGVAGSSSQSADVAVVSHVAVDARCHGSGVGRKLVAAFLAEIGDRHVDEVRLVTSIDGDAAAFYERLGWDRLAERTAADGTAVLEFAFRPLP